MPAPNVLFKLASKKDSRLRMLLQGSSGSGKTFTALVIATAICPPGKKIAFIDSERGSATKYADKFTFDTLDLLDTFGDTSPTSYITAINAAVASGYAVIVVDSISHEWAGLGGALEMKDEIVKTKPGRNDFTAWGDVTPIHGRFIDAMIGVKADLIACARTKMKYVLEENQKGRTVPRRVGMEPITREQVDFEFDLVLSMEKAGKESIATEAKTRFDTLSGGSWVNIGNPKDTFIAQLKAALHGEDPLPNAEPAASSETGEKPGAAPSPFAEALFWAQSAPRINATNRALVAGQFRSWASKFPSYATQIVATDLPQTKVEKFRKWLEEQHVAAVTGNPTEDAPKAEEEHPPEDSLGMDYDKKED